MKVTMTCKGECRKIDIDPSLMKEDEKEIVEDLVKAAINDANSKNDGGSWLAGRHEFAVLRITALTN